MRYLIVLICLLASCQSYRAERKINKLKQWGYLSDSTITRYDTIRGWSLDSVYIFDTTTILDTITRIENGLKVSTVIKWKERQVIQTLTQKDTIFEHKYTTKVIKEKCKWSWWEWNNLSAWFFIIWLILSLIWVIYISIYSIKKL
jgi:hypothetical protein